MDNLNQSIPIVNICALVENTPEKIQVAKDIRAACKTYGFFYIVGHGIHPNLEQDLEEKSQIFFSQPKEIKEEISMNLGGRAWRGYFPLGDELTSGKPDMKEGVYFGAELEDDHPLVQAKTPLHGKNLFPGNIPHFKETFLHYISEMTRLGHILMEGIALSLNLDEKYFSEFFTEDPLPLFRIFNYPSTLGNPGSKESESWGVGEHTDYGILTILKQDNIGGLEVKTKKTWIQAPPVPGSFICNIGDMLERLTGGFYKSTPHRVRRPTQNVDRLSFPFFFDPNFNSEVKAIPNLGHMGSDEDDDERWDKANVHQFQGTYGQYLLNKVSKVFPQLHEQVL